MIKCIHKLHLPILISAVTYLSCSPSKPENKSVTKTPQESSVLELIILGTIQDGGSPHTGCKKECCAPLFQSENCERKVVSLGLIDHKNDKNWLFEATPDFPEQMSTLLEEANSSKKVCDGIFITHAHIGHYTGLMFLGREVMNANRVTVYGMPRFNKFITQNGPWSQLIDLENITLKTLSTDSIEQLSENYSIKTFSIPHRDEFSETAGFVINGPNKSALFIPDIDKWENWSVDINEMITQVDYAFLDATFYDESEIPGRKMSEIPHPFVVESMERFSSLPDSVKSKVIFIHLNHTNPLLNEESEQYQTVKKAGYKIAKKGDRYLL